jgi:predicted aspartyl protease
LKRSLPILFLLVSFSGLCDNHPATPPNVNLSIFLSTHSYDFKTLVIPIRRVENLILIEARIDDQAGNFILDTGSPDLVLNKTYFRNAWKSDKYAANAAGQSAAPVFRTNINNLAIKELTFENLRPDLSDLGHIENYRDIKILGLLGVSLFTSFEMIIDPYKNVIYLHRPDKKGLVPDSEKIVKSEPILKIPFRLVHNIIILDVIVAEKKLAFCVDTGAETNAISNLLPSKILQTFKVSKRMLLLGTGGSQAEILLGTLNEVTIGHKSFKNMHTAITNLDELSSAYGRSIDGILGGNFLVKGVISINFVTKELCMYPFDISNL